MFGKRIGKNSRKGGKNMIDFKEKIAEILADATNLNKKVNIMKKLSLAPQQIRLLYCY